MTPDQLTLRLDELGLTREASVDPSATIRSPADLAQTTTDHDLSRTRREVRELPLISIDLRVRAESSEDLVRRDLEVLSVLGEGGMGRVYLAHQHSLDRDVAIKSLHSDGEAWHHRALLEEGAVTGHLEHPAIIPVHALGVDTTGRPILVMKRVEGVPWLDLIRDPSHAAWRDRGGDPTRRLDDHLEILMQVCNAAHYAHSKRIVHRDIKPQNVMIGSFGAVYLADWGIAFRMDVETTPDFCGTPSYMAPEMAVGGMIDERTDVYLLGATLHQVLTGAPKHTGRVARDVLTSAIKSVPFVYQASVPPGLAEIANRATHLNRAERFQTAAELRIAIFEHQRHQSSRALATSALSRVAKIRELLGSGADRAREDALREVDLSIAEARFGLGQSLEQWTDNAAAQEGLRELEALMEARRARSAELERLAQDLDPKTASRQRWLAQIGAAVVGVALSASAFVRGVDNQPSASELTMQAILPVAAFGIAIALFRKQLFRTEVSRRAMRSFGVCVVLILAERVIGSRAGMAPSSMLFVDSLLGAAPAFVIASGHFRWLYVPGAIMCVTAVACGLDAKHAFLDFSIGSALALVSLVYFGGRMTNFFAPDPS